MPDILQTQLGFSVLLMGVVIGVMLTAVAYCIYFERKICAAMQDRYGPNRVGPKGLLQPLADGVKFILKEDIIPAQVDKALFILAPMVIFVVALVTFAVIPWGGSIEFASGRRVDVQVASLDIGLLYILGVASMSVYGIVLGGWASNNKYSFYGGMRAAAQMLSYEIPMGLAILAVVLTTGHLRLERIVAAQVDPALGGCWNVLLHPVACVLLVITLFAEANRTPFDLAEAEQELVGGYHTEYSAMKLAMFFLAEYAGMITMSAMTVALFFGGWEPFPFSGRLGWGWLDWINHGTHWSAAVVRAGIVIGKVAFFIFVFMWVRWTIPRFRFDQLMRLAWKGLVPIGLGTVVLAGTLVYAGRPVSVWATVGNGLLVAAVLLITARASSPVTGRQSHLPPVPVGEGVLK